MVRLIVFFLLLSSTLFAQQAANNPRWSNGFWHAKWIAHPTAQGTQFGVFHFRKTFNLSEIPKSFIIHVSADNRYQLDVNGNWVSAGPARSDLANWNYETIDIAPYLTIGKNVLAATVWNFGDYRGYYQISFQTAFLLQGDSPNEEIVNTDKSWKVIQDTAYSPLPIDRAALHTYIVVPEGQALDGNKYPWHFERQEFDDANWLPAQQLWYAAKARTFGTDGNWQLVPRTIPLLGYSMDLGEDSQFSQSDVVEGEAIVNYHTKYIGQSLDQAIPPNTKTSFIIDHNYLTNAFPVIFTSGGKDAVVTLTYAEAMVDAKGNKGNRDSTFGKHIEGLSDRFILDGGKARDYTSLYTRTFRYIKIDVETKNDPLKFERDPVFLSVVYPFQEKASFSSDDSSLSNIWKVGWRTARLCAQDTYYDCPYYEQLQYVGDTRIQAMISLYVSGDDRLMKKAIDDISHSFIPDGITQSRYPSRDLQVIPTFSLWWVCMIHDFWMHRKEDAFVRSHIKGIKQVMEWYNSKMYTNDMLGKLSWWEFVDWSWPWKDSVEVGGVPPGVSDGGSSIISLQYAYTLQRAAELMAYCGDMETSVKYTALAKKITAATYRICWDANKRMLADTWAKKSFSQHANILAVLTDAIPANDQQDLIKRIIADHSITQATYYFKFYLFEALKKVKLGNEFLPLLQPWYDMLKIGLTTFAENPEPTRSDCHGWSASPVYEFLSLVSGIKPATPGFEKVIIEPYPGTLNHISAKMPHPKGLITLELTKTGNGIHAKIELPSTVSGTFIWKGKSQALKPGKQEISLN